MVDFAFIEGKWIMKEWWTKVMMKGVDMRIDEMWRAVYVDCRI